MKSKWIVVLVATPVVLFGASYLGYLRGIEAQAALEAPYIPVIQGLTECQKKQDWECVRITNKMMSVMLASKMEVLVEEALVDDSVREDVEAFLEWHNATWTD